MEIRIGGRGLKHYYKEEWNDVLKIKGDEPFVIWGMSSFTSFRWEKGACALDLHYKRLVEGARYLGMEGPGYEEYLKVLYVLERRLLETGGFAKVRLAWVQNVEGCSFWLKLDSYSEQYVIQGSKVLELYDLNEAEIVASQRKYKLGNYAHHRIAYAKRKEADDSLLVSDGNVIESTMASVIGLWQNKVYVSSSKNRLESIAEFQLINFLKYKYEIVYGISKEFLLSSNEACWYYCNSLQGVLPISSINGQKQQKNTKEWCFLKEIVFFQKKHIKALGSSAQLSIIDLTEVARD